MSRWYIDTSAAIKLLVTEDESEALASAIDAEQPELVACHLLETELRRAALRHGVTQADATQLLDGVDLYDIPGTWFRQAGLMPGAGLRSLDAIHVSAALNLDVDVVLSYDTRLSEAAASVGLPVICPV